MLVSLAARRVFEMIFQHEDRLIDKLTTSTQGQIRWASSAGKILNVNSASRVNMRSGDAERPGREVLVADDPKLAEQPLREH